MSKNEDYLLLKWGTIKGFRLDNNPIVFALMEDYYKDGVCMSVMAQKDTPRQKELILRMIDAMNGTIQNDFDGTIYESKEDAKKYILDYEKK